jgi:trehalose 6-phosphate phosphatase
MEHRVKRPGRLGRLLLLDLDGTIADIEADPSDAAIDASTLAALADLAAPDPLGLVIVTGRALADADRMLGGLKLPVLASHGAEARVLGFSLPESGASIVAVRGRIEEIAARCPGVLVEWKPYSAAFHFRPVPELGPRVWEALCAFVGDHPAFRIQGGRMVVEVLPAGMSKARAVDHLLHMQGYRQRRPIYVGDDPADEAAMAVVEALGGTALRVAGEHFSSDVADFDGPADVRMWLAALVADARLHAVQ